MRLFHRKSRAGYTKAGGLNRIDRPLSCCRLMIRRAARTFAAPVSESGLERGHGIEVAGRIRFFSGENLSMLPHLAAGGAIPCLLWCR